MALNGQKLGAHDPESDGGGGLPGAIMDRQPTKTQPQTEIRKSKNRQQEAECSQPNKQVMTP